MRLGRIYKAWVLFPAFCLMLGLAPPAAQAAGETMTVRSQNAVVEEIGLGVLTYYVATKGIPSGDYDAILLDAPSGVEIENEKSKMTVYAGGGGLLTLTVRGVLPGNYAMTLSLETTTGSVSAPLHLHVSAHLYDVSSGLKFTSFSSDGQENIAWVAEKGQDDDPCARNCVIPSEVSKRNITCEVTRIADSAFYKCQDIQAVTIPESITMIGAWAFYGCANLRSISFLGDVPPRFGLDPFLRISHPLTVVVPHGTMDEYQAVLQGILPQGSVIEEREG